MNKILCLLLLIAFGFSGCHTHKATATATTPQSEGVKFDFGPGNVQSGYTQVLPETRYTPERGYGIDLGSTVTANSYNGKDDLRDDYIFPHFVPLASYPVPYFTSASLSST